MSQNKNNSQQPAAKEITVRGLVQGVGFRPFIYRLAHRHHLTGWVQNTNESVLIRVEGEAANCEAFAEEVIQEKPWASEISGIDTRDTEPSGAGTFRIFPSEDRSNEVTRVSPDIAVCDDCLGDLEKSSRRRDYPLVNCTHCGPRFSIVCALPYDRAHTTMAAFAMCRYCREEYSDVWDRRFHAQPIACNCCGPQYELVRNGLKITGLQDILATMVWVIQSGGVLALKGTGGFHLVCDALNKNAVQRLRTIKKRDQKPFAVMFRNLATLRAYSAVNDAEAQALQHWRRPVVLLRQTKVLASGINNGFATLGAMLPYMPMHYLLFQHVQTPALVMTSGNFSDAPIVIDNNRAIDSFGRACDAVVVYNRAIHNRVDDSVVTVVRDKQRLIRRARGFVPVPVEVPFEVDNLLATGAELSNCFAAGKGKQVLMSQHIGDLKDYDTYTFYTETVEKFKTLFRIDPAMVVHDKHPDYVSTEYARGLDIPQMEVQHHHAHVAACMAEYGLKEPVIGICFDGTGLGDDGHLWGGECMYVQYDSYERYAHLQYVPLPGGDTAVKEPWRAALAYAYQCYGQEALSMHTLWHRVDPGKLETVAAMLRRNINCPLSSGAGRLFDAVAALTDVCIESDFHAQAPMKLEALINDSVPDEYPFSVDKMIRVKEVIKGIIHDVEKKIPAPVIAAKFHNTLVSVIFVCVNRMTEKYHTRKVVLSGGVFQNKYLLEKVEERLEKGGFDVYSPVQTPCNDGGLALGQIAVAAHRKQLSKTI